MDFSRDGHKLPMRGLGSHGVRDHESLSACDFSNNSENPTGDIADDTSE